MTKTGKTAPTSKKTGSSGKLMNGGVDPQVGKATQIQPGEVRNPGGRPKSKPFTEALLQALANQPELLQQITENALKRAKNSLSDYREVREIVEGKIGAESEGSEDGRHIVHNLNIRFVDPGKK